MQLPLEPPMLQRYSIMPLLIKSFLLIIWGEFGEADSHFREAAEKERGGKGYSNGRVVMT